MDVELIITLAGLTVAGLAAVLGIWVERDEAKPPRYAYALSILILLATMVGMYQCYSDAKQGEKLEADMARMLQMLDKISNESEVEIPELDELVRTEIAAQSRANPKVVTKLAQRVADEGGDPGEMLGKHLPPSEMEGLQRKGELTVKPSTAGVRPMILLGPKGDGSSGGKRPRLLRKKDGDEAPASTASAAEVANVAAAAPTAAATGGEPHTIPVLLPKGSLDLKPSLGAKPEGTIKGPAAGPKVDPTKIEGTKPLGVKPKP
jgi:hypothetical protein